MARLRFPVVACLVRWGTLTYATVICMLSDHCDLRQCPHCHLDVSYNEKLITYQDRFCH